MNTCPKCGYDLSGKSDYAVEETTEPISVTPLPEFIYTPKAMGYDAKQDNPIQGIAISGKARSGKSTLADMLIERLGKPWHIDSISDPIMIEWCEENKPVDYATEGPDWCLKWANENKESIRAELIELGQRRREQDPDYWLNRLSCVPNAIVPNCRFTNEWGFFKNKGFYMIRVEATPEIREARGCPDLNDPSECELDSIDYKEWDYIVYNDLGFTVLGDQADCIVEDITRRMTDAV